MKHKTLSKEEIAAWESFIKFINRTETNKSLQTSRRKININYIYLDIEYEQVEVKYLILDNDIIGIEFFVPEHPNSTLSCRLINRVQSVSSAIEYIYELSKTNNRS